MLVVTQRVEDGTTLIVVGRHDVAGEQLFDAFFVVVEILGEVVLEFFLQRLEFGLCVVVVALKLRHLLKIVESLLAHGVVFEMAVEHALLKLVVVGIAEIERSGGADGRMLGNIVHLIAGDELVGVFHGSEIISEVGHGVCLHLHVRHDASAVHHLAAVGCVEGALERVSNDFGRTAVGMFIGDLLDTATRRNIIFVGRQLHLAVVRQIHHGLNKPFAVGLRTHDHGSVHIL